jgi:ABC-type tungstate transport system substrate-binding protein
MPVTGNTSGYVNINIYFHTPDGLVKINVEAYIVSVQLCCCYITLVLVVVNNELEYLVHFQKFRDQILVITIICIGKSTLPFPWVLLTVLFFVRK